MPIAEEIYAVLYEGRDAANAYRGLQRRKAGHERDSGGTAGRQRLLA